MSKHKDKRIQRVLGYTKASHKGAVIYFTKEKPEKSVRSLKKKKVCKFTKGLHKFVIEKNYEPSEYFVKQGDEYISKMSNGFCILKCELCGKKEYGDSSVVVNTPLCERDK